MYALLQSAAISGMRGGAPVTDDEYERGAPIVAAKAHLSTGLPCAAIGAAIGGPVGGIIGYFAGAILFGAPKVLKADMAYNAQARGRR